MGGAIRFTIAATMLSISVGIKIMLLIIKVIPIILDKLTNSTKYSEKYASFSDSLDSFQSKFSLKKTK
jgi:hypothetical protein